MNTKRILYFVAAALIMVVVIAAPFIFHWFITGWNIFWLLPFQFILGWLAGDIFAQALFMKDGS